MADGSHFDNDKSSYLSNDMADHHAIGQDDAFCPYEYIRWST